MAISAGTYAVSVVDLKTGESDYSWNKSIVFI